RAAASNGNKIDDQSRSESGAKNVERSELETLTSLVRSAVETFVLEGRVIEKPDSEEPILQQRAACFVSIKTDEGDLRGCIGTIEPAKETLAEELITNDVSSATRDPRFHAVAAKELPDLRYSVDVLTAPEHASFEELDPKIYGVIVEDERGARRG